MPSCRQSEFQQPDDKFPLEAVPSMKRYSRHEKDLNNSNRWSEPPVAFYAYQNSISDQNQWPCYESASQYHFTRSQV